MSAKRRFTVRLNEREGAGTEIEAFDELDALALAIEQVESENLIDAVIGDFGGLTAIVREVQA